MASHLLPGLLLGLISLHIFDDPGPGELVTQLGAPKYADRETAGEALVKIGTRALPALAKASESSDPEVRLRAETLVARIEASEVLGVTRFTLDIRDRPLAEAAHAIEKASGMRLKLGASNGNPQVERTWPERRVTVQAAEPVPFWDIIDRLCQAADLQREYPPAWNAAFPFTPPFDLILVGGKARPPKSDTGALRVELVRVRHHRVRDYRNNVYEFSPLGESTAQKRDTETGATERSSYTAELVVSGEPRLRIFGVGEVENAEAVDDQGRSLLRRPTAAEEEQKLSLRRMNPHLDPKLHPALRYGSFSHPSMRSSPVPVVLSYPSPPARRITLLRGVIPVAVVARRPGPLVVELKGASGKEFAADSTKITVHKIDAESGREPTVDFTLETAQSGAEETIVVCDPKGVRLAVHRPSDLMELCLEVVDSRSERLYWQFTRAPTRNIQGRMTIVIRDRNSKRQRPDDLRLRYWRMIATATDLPFVFKDVPTP
jgi:hypothetical protein